MKPISYFGFDRKRSLKTLRNRFNHFIISTKLFRTKNDKIARLNYDRILNLVNITFQNKATFDSNNIFYVLQAIEMYCNFVAIFSDSIKNTNDIDLLKDIQIEFFQKQAELEEFLKENLEKPYTIDLTTISESEDANRNKE